MSFEQFLTNIGNWISEFSMTAGARILGALLVLFVGFKLTKFILKLIRKTPKFKHIDKGAETFIFSFISISLKVLVILTAFAILGVPMTNFATVLGSAGIAIGLALQGTLANFAGGLMILMFHPFRVGDFITANGQSGTVKEMSILYTILDTPDNVRVVVPNGQLSNATVQNYSVNETRRIDFDIQVAYETDLDLAQKKLKEIAENHENVLKDRDIQTMISTYDESGITLKLRLWVKASDYWPTFFDITGKIKKALDQENIVIPFPQLDVHIDK